MIGQGLFIPLLSGLLLLVTGTLPGLPGLAVGGAVSSLLSGTNFTVPEYVTRYGIQLAHILSTRDLRSF